MEPTIKLYIGALVAHWVDLITGGIVAAVYAVYQGIFHKTWPNWAFVAVFVVGGFFAASYQAWEDQVALVNESRKEANQHVIGLKRVSLDWQTRGPVWIGNVSLEFDGDMRHPYFLVITDNDCILTLSASMIDVNNSSLAPNVWKMDYQFPAYSPGETLALSISANQEVHIVAVVPLPRRQLTY